MRILFRFLVTVVLVLYTSITYSQNDFVTLTSSDFIKGLGNKDFLRGKLKENGYTVVGKGGTGKSSGGSYESWHVKELLYVDMISEAGARSTITVAIRENVTGFPERLIQSFPRKQNEQRNVALTPNIKPVNKDISYSLVFPGESNNIHVLVWFDAPYYFFQYKEEKKEL